MERRKQLQKYIQRAKTSLTFEKKHSYCTVRLVFGIAF